jgi:hypothetical protein
MDDNTSHTDDEFQSCISEQLRLVRRWLAELEGTNRHRAYDLMQRVMAVEITSEEAFAILEGK